MELVCPYSCKLTSCKPTSSLGSALGPVLANEKQGLLFPLPKWACSWYSCPRHSECNPSHSTACLSAACLHHRLSLGAVLDLPLWITATWGSNQSITEVHHTNLQVTLCCRAHRHTHTHTHTHTHSTLHPASLWNGFSSTGSAIMGHGCSLKQWLAFSLGSVLAYAVLPSMRYSVLILQTCATCSHNPIHHVRAQTGPPNPTVWICSLHHRNEQQWMGEQYIFQESL